MSSQMTFTLDDGRRFLLICSITTYLNSADDGDDFRRLVEFAAEHGPRWKSQLSTDWYRREPQHLADLKPKVGISGLRSMSIEELKFAA